MVLPVGCYYYYHSFLLAFILFLLTLHLTTPSNSTVIILYHNNNITTTAHDGEIPLLLASPPTQPFVRRKEEEEVMVHHTRQLSILTKKYAAVFTPFDLTPGGGEKYLLTSIMVLQDLGYHVHLLLHRHNVIQTVEGVERTASALHVRLDLTMLTLDMVDVQGGRLVLPPNPPPFEVFYSIGNIKYPDIFPIAGTKFNIYMCQFPFNFNEPFYLHHFNVYVHYDVVIVNSHYTEDWYLNSTNAAREQIMIQSRPYPSVSIIHPPVQPIMTFHKDSSNQVLNGRGTDHIRIVMLGRFFSGRQSKGHFEALDIFQSLLDKLSSSSGNSQKVTLFMLGYIQPGFEQYVIDLRKRILELNLPVEVINGSGPEEIASILSQSHLFWHLTGINVNILEDPASVEHFGVAVVEAMSTGCVPIVLNRGGTIDIVKHGINGFLANDAEDYIQYTLNVIDQFRSFDERSSQRIPWEQMSYLAMKTSKRFHVDNFRFRLGELVLQGVSSHTYRTFSWKLVKTFKSLSAKAPTSQPNRNLAAVIVVTNLQNTFEAAIRNTMYHLGDAWHLFIVCTKELKPFVESATNNFHFSYSVVDLQDVFPLVGNVHNVVSSEKYWRYLHEQGMKKVLLFSESVLLVNHNISQHLSYDFISITTNYPKYRLLSQLQKDEVTYSIGDFGMFNLRSVSTMLHFTELSQAKYRSNTLGLTKSFIIREKEEMMLKKLFVTSRFKVANPEISALFCNGKYDSSPVYDPEVLALHGAWFYMTSQVVELYFSSLLDQISK